MDSITLATMPEKPHHYVRTGLGLANPPAFKLLFFSFIFFTASLFSRVQRVAGGLSAFKVYVDNTCRMVVIVCLNP